MWTKVNISINITIHVKALNILMVSVDAVVAIDDDNNEIMIDNDDNDSLPAFIRFWCP